MIAVILVVTIKSVTYKICNAINEQEEVYTKPSFNNPNQALAFLLILLPMDIVQP